MNAPVNPGEFGAAAAAADVVPVAKTSDPHAMILRHLQPYIMAEVLHTHAELATEAQKNDAAERARRIRDGAVNALASNDGAVIDKYLNDELRACVQQRNQGEPVQYIQHLVDDLKTKANERFTATNEGQPAMRTIISAMLDSVLDQPAATRAEQRTGGFTANI